MTEEQQQIALFVKVRECFMDLALRHVSMGVPGNIIGGAMAALVTEFVPKELVDEMYSVRAATRGE